MDRGSNILVSLGIGIGIVASVVARLALAVMVLLVADFAALVGHLPSAALSAVALVFWHFVVLLLVDLMLLGFVCCLDCLVLNLGIWIDINTTTLIVIVMYMHSRPQTKPTDETMR